MKEALEQIELKQLSLPSTKGISYHLHRSVIHILFSVEKQIEFAMGPNRIPLAPFSSYLFYEQHHGIPLEVHGQDAEMFALEIPIKTLHNLVSKGMDELNFESGDIFEKERYHKFSPNNESVNNCLRQLITDQNPLMREAKKYELLSLYFSAQDVKTYKCPFLNQKENVVKVRNAKELLIKDLQNSPTIKELSKEVGLNEHNLKTGFKEIYSKPIHTFLKDHKMNTARSLIETREYKVNEVAEQVGYSNVSHFIEAFKKKFGATPKQYELNERE